MAATIDALRGIGHHAFLGYFLVALAELRALAGDLEGALDTIDDARLSVDKTGEMLHLPEILRRRVFASPATGRAKSVRTPASSSRRTSSPSPRTST